MSLTANQEILKKDLLRWVNKKNEYILHDYQLECLDMRVANKLIDTMFYVDDYGQYRLKKELR